MITINISIIKIKKLRLSEGGHKATSFYPHQNKPIQIVLGIFQYVAKSILSFAPIFICMKNASVLISILHLIKLRHRTSISLCNLLLRKKFHQPKAYNNNNLRYLMILQISIWAGLSCMTLLFHIALKSLSGIHLAYGLVWRFEDGFTLG